METLSSIQFWLFFHLFFVAAFMSVFLPGIILVRKVRFADSSTKIIIGVVLGIILWSAQGYILGYLHLRFLTYLYLFASLYCAVKMRYEILGILQDALTELKKVDKKIVWVILLGMVFQILPVIGSGLIFKDGVRYFGVNGSDGLMHLGYIQSIVKSFPPREPGAIGNLITNYHYWSDLFFGELVRIWHLPIVNTFFQYTPPLVSLLTGIALYKLMQKFTTDKRVHFAALFFLYFAGDAAYIFMLILHQAFGFYTPAIDNGVTQFLNMPHAMAKLIFLTALIPMQLWLRTNQKYYLLLTIIILAALTGFKVYFAIYSLIGLGSLLLYSFLSVWFTENRKELTYIKNAGTAIKKMLPFLAFSILFLVLFLLIFLPPNKNAGGLYYSPLEWSKLLLGAGGLNFQPWWYLYSKYTTSHNILALTLLNIIAILITFISIYGTRMIGFFIGKNIYRTIGGKNIAFFLPGLVIFNILGLSTLQKSGGLNVFNFFAVSTIVLAIFSSFTIVSLWLTGSRLKKAVVICLLFLTVPRCIYEVYFYTRSYITQENAYTIPNNELKALDYIKKNTPPDYVVQSHPMNHLDRKVPYVAFYTDRDTYLTGVDLQRSHNQPIEERVKDLDVLFRTPNSMAFLKEVEARGIDLLYIQKNLGDQYLLTDINEDHFKPIFQNENIIVYDPVEGF